VVSDVPGKDLRVRGELIWHHLKSLMEEANASSILEGAATTRKKAKLRSGQTPHHSGLGKISFLWNRCPEQNNSNTHTRVPGA
jgi:hypothetical protein